MHDLFAKFIQGLEIPQNIVDGLGKPRTNEELKTYALSLPSLVHPDTNVLAGRLLIYLNIKSCPKKIEDYATILDKVLRPEISSFMKEHSEIINQVLEETYYKNFEDHNIMSASSCINYLLKLSPDECAMETPCQMMMRLAVQFYHDETIEKVLGCYHDMIEFNYVHASPTLFNAGTRKNQMSSCFLLTLGDNLESLMTGVYDSGMISSAQGGVGLSLNGIRHSNISNTGKSSGVLPFGRIYDSTIMCVDQGGKRNGAMTITLNDWHIDFFDFIQARDNFTQNGIRFKQANICAYVTDLFMERVRKGEKWTMFCPAKAKMMVGGVEKRLYGLCGEEFEDLYVKLEQEAFIRQAHLVRINKEIELIENKINTNQATEEETVTYHKKIMERLGIRKNLIEHRVMDAQDVYRTICDMHNKSSMPYIVYRDTVNYKNNMKNIGVCEGLNLCLEITEPSTPDSIASCNLGHLNLKKFVKNRPSTKRRLSSDDYYPMMYDFEGLGRATQRLVENINKVILFNFYPLDKRDGNGNVYERGKISRPNFENRPIGIGVSGLAEVFALLDLPYDSEEAKRLNKLIFACMYYNSLLMSLELAKIHGEYANFRTGKSRLFIEEEWKEFNGSPLSNGYFQFDMWKQEAEYYKSKGRLNEKIYDIKDNIPCEPVCWGQEGSWSRLRKDIMEHGVRNSMLIALMPTASSSQLLRNAETTEAHQTLMYSRKLAHGNFVAYSEPFVKDMIESGLWNEECIEFIMMDNGSIRYLDKFVEDNPKYFSEDVYEDGKLKPAVRRSIEWMQKIHRGMYEISQKDTMQMSRQRGIYVCQAQSFNIYIGEPNVSKLQAVHNYSNALKLKTGMYYLRQNPASQTNRFTVDMEIQTYYNSLGKKGNTIVTDEARKKKIVCTAEVCTSCS
jgi:ribonucleoside-diphosphate reductase alpha chain